MSNEGNFAILIVDDEPSVLLTYRLILEKKGYAVRTAETSTDALRLLSACKFDLLLCDYSLEQEHTGFEVIQAARIDDPLVSAVLLTGYASIETVERANRDN
ncbi:MAG: response regulator, partial [Acidobacteriaceae bacterium]